MSISMNKIIRKARQDDAPFIFAMIQELANYEKASERVSLSLEQLIWDGFQCENPLFESIIIEFEQQNAGMALYYNRYSTWKGKSLYLEDLYIKPEFRKNGLGKLTMNWLAKEAVETNCKRFEWQVLDWNEPSIEFYKSIQTDLDPEWINCRLEGNYLLQLAENK